jgi:predicted enzyme related to lactoylglutathione lyase
MPETRVLAPGTFCWCEVGTADAAAAKKFYGELFGWTTTDVPAGDAGTYTMIRLDGRDVGGLYELSKEMREQGVPPHWLAYVKVASADATAAKAGELGGRVVMGPFDVMTAGRMAVVQDPTGGTFALWQPKEHAGAGAMGEVGSPCWHELISTDKAEAGAFYAALLSWQMESFLGAMDYTIFKQEEKSVAGLMQRTEEMGEVPSHWMIYFAVEDCDASAEKAARLGGEVCVPPTDIPQVGRFAVLADPGGAMFAVIRLTNPGGA